MRLLSRRRGGFTSVDLGQSWRLGVAATPTTAGVGLGLVWRWPPSTAAAVLASPGQTLVPLGDASQWALAVAEVSLAKAPADLGPVATVALENGSMDADIQRVTEAMGLFRNLPRFRDEALRTDIDGVISLVRAYWRITDWAMSPSPERLELAVGDAALVGTP